MAAENFKNYQDSQTEGKMPTLSSKTADASSHTPVKCHNIVLNYIIENSTSMNKVEKDLCS